MKDYQGITGKKSKYISIVFFLIGLLGAIGFRIILLLNRIDYLLASIAWYLAVILYIFFYAYRVYIEDRRRKIIIKNQLR